MKLFHPVVTDVAGTVTEIRVQTDDSVEVGDILVTIEVA